MTNLVHGGVNVLKGEVVEAAKDAKKRSTLRSPSLSQEPPKEKSTHLRPITLTAMSFHNALTVVGLNLSQRRREKVCQLELSSPSTSRLSSPPSSLCPFSTSTHFGITKTPTR